MKFKILVLMLLLPQVVFAAQVFGTVYDLSLQPQHDVIVKVDSTPAQTYIAKEGTYSFTLNPGNYKITAEYSENGILLSSADAEVQIVEDGSYRVDLILLDVTEEDLLNDTDFEVVSGIEDGTSPWAIAGIILLALAILISYPAYRFMKARRAEKEEEQEIKPEGVIRKVERSAQENPPEETMEQGKEEPKTKAVHEELADDLEKVLKIIKDEGGRTTQKLIRKKLGLSEAKISLMVTELEHKSLVVRIKKGRGNVIALKTSS